MNIRTTLHRTAAALLVVVLLSAHAVAQSGFWRRTAGPQGGYPVGTAFEFPGHYFMLSGRHLFTSRDSGRSWEIVGPNVMPSLPLCMAADSSGRLYLGITNGSVYRSDDFGAGWAEISRLPGGSPAYGLVVAAGGIYASGLEKLFRSTDSGRTWQAMPFRSASGEALPSIWIDRLLNPAPASVMAMQGGNLYILDTSSTALRQTADTHALRWIDVTRGPGGDWYAATDRGVWRADDPWGNWEPTGLEGAVHAVIGTPGGALLAARGSDVLMSVDSGASWSVVPTPGLGAVPFAFARIDADRVMMISGVDLNVLDVTTRTVDPVRSVPVASTVPALAALAEDVIYAGMPGRVYRSTDLGDTWTQIPPPSASAPEIALLARPNGTLLAIANYALHVSRDGGLTWRNRGPVSGSATRLVSGPGDVVFAFGSADTVFLRSTDDGETWSTVDYRQFRPYKVRDIVMTGSGAVVLATDRTLHQSTDGGATWESIAAPSFNYARMAVAPEGTVYLLGVSSYRSNDAGRNWVPITPPPTGMPNVVAALAGRRIYATYSNGGFFSDDGGASWRSVETEAGDRVISAVVTPEGILFAGTEGGGVLRHDEVGGVERAEPVHAERERIGASERPMIVSAGPMPASGRLGVELRLPRGGAPDLRLYDARGAAVACLGAEEHAPGLVHLELNLAGIPAGVYLLRVTCGADVCVRRVVVRR